MCLELFRNSVTSFSISKLPSFWSFLGHQLHEFRQKLLKMHVKNSNFTHYFDFLGLISKVSLSNLLNLLLIFYLS